MGDTPSHEIPVSVSALCTTLRVSEDEVVSFELVVVGAGAGAEVEPLVSSLDAAFIVGCSDLEGVVSEEVLITSEDDESEGVSA